jgi:ribosomal protein L37AE/L43A
MRTKQHFCACGNPAVKRFTGLWTCARCVAIDSKRYLKEQQRRKQMREQHAMLGNPIEEMP